MIHLKVAYALRLLSGYKQEQKKGESKTSQKWIMPTLHLTNTDNLRLLHVRLVLGFTKIFYFDMLIFARL